MSVSSEPLYQASADTRLLYEELLNKLPKRNTIGRGEAELTISDHLRSEGITTGQAEGVAQRAFSYSPRSKANEWIAALIKLTAWNICVSGLPLLPVHSQNFTDQQFPWQGTSFSTRER